MRERSEPRVRTKLRTGVIFGKGGRFIADCLIQDRSARGARLMLAAVVMLPKEFQLHDEAADAATSAQLRWQRGNVFGVYFPDGLEMCRHPQAQRFIGTSVGIGLIRVANSALAGASRYLPRR